MKAKYLMNHPTNGKDVPMDEEMCELRKKLLAAFGYVIRPCSIGPTFGKPVGPRLCIEREAMTSELNGVKHSSYHAVFEDWEGGFWNFPDEVQKAAHAIDKSKPKRAAKVQP